MRSIILIIATIVLIANAMKQPTQTPLWKADSEISKEFEIAQAKYLKDRAAGKAKSQNVAKDQSLQLEAKTLAYSRTKPGTLSFFEPTIPFVSKKVDAGASLKRGEMATYHPVVLDFMQQNGNSFGLRDVSNEIVFKQTRPVDENATNVVYKQQHNGFPVYGGEILFQFNDQHLSIGMVVNTMVNTDSALDTVAKISKERAEEIAFTASGNPQNVVVTQSSLQFYNKDHYFEREGPTKLCWVIVLKTTQQFVNFQHRLFINAITGEVEQDVDLSEGALNRRFYKGTTSTTTYQEGQTVGSDTVLQTMVRGAADVYYAMKNLTNYDSFNNAGGQMKGLYDAALKDSSGNSACPNAYWDSVQTNYCPNLGTYDVIVHEWGHAYTEYYSNLEYQGMSGALNEGYSDIYAETLQLLNNIPSTYTVRTSYSCLTNIATRTGGARWIIGDQITGVSAFTDGLRDMWSPNCKSQPEDTSDTDYAVCNTASGADNGGVHTNSGIPNKAYASFVDGIIGNPSVPGVGLVKAINVYARAALSHTESSTFANHYSLLNTACTQLVGQTIKNPATGATSTSITSGDCTQLTAALNLVGMNAGLCGGNSNSGSTKPTLTSYYPPYQSRSAATSVVAFVGQGFKSTAGCVFTSGIYIGFTNGDAYDSTNGQFQFFFCDFDGTDWASFTNVNGTVANDISARVSGDTTSVANQYGPLIMYTNPYVSSWTTDGATVTFYRGALGGFFQQYSGCNPGSIDANGDSYDCLSCWWTSDFTTSHQYAATFIDSGSISCKIPAGKSPFQDSMYFSLNGWVFTNVDRSLYVDSASSIFVSMFVLIGSLFVALLF